MKSGNWLLREAFQIQLQPGLREMAPTTFAWRQSSRDREGVQCRDTIELDH
jgi:hypothetical protein